MPPWLVALVGANKVTKLGEGSFAPVFQEAVQPFPRLARRQHGHLAHLLLLQKLVPQKDLRNGDERRPIPSQERGHQTTKTAEQ